MNYPPNKQDFGSNFKGRVALITGAGGGLGRAYAHRLARQGATVIVNDRAYPDRPNTAHAVVSEILAFGGQAVADEHSVHFDDQAKAMIDHAYEKFGKLDVLICNAGVSGSGLLQETTAAAFSEIFDVSFYGALHPVRAALQRMCDAGYGRIIATTSSAGFFASPGTPAYAAAKSALIGLFRAIAGETAAHGVKANLISPMAWTRMAEPFLDKKYSQMLDPDHVAKVVAWLASEACNISGEILVAGGGKVYRATVVQGPGLPIGDGDIAQLWAELSNLESARECSHGMETVQNLMAEFDANNAG